MLATMRPPTVDIALQSQRADARAHKIMQGNGMSDSGKNYGLLSDLSGIEETQNPMLQRHARAGQAIVWLAAGWRDLWHRPLPSLLYGALVLLTSTIIVGGLFYFQLDYILLPALAGFMVVGPLVAIGLYQKSRDIEAGMKPKLSRMVFVKPESGAQTWFAGAVLCMLMLLWTRAAVIIYALFFGVNPFPGLDHLLNTLLTTPEGISMLVVGTLVGGLFAAFAFSISALAIPMLLAERTDALTAMGTSMALVWNNLPVMLTWAAIVLALFALSVATGLVGLIVIFPLLGHATWHSYRAMR